MHWVFTIRKPQPIKNWQKVIKLWDQSRHFINFAPEFHQICALFADITEFSIGLESSLFRKMS